MRCAASLRPPGLPWCRTSSRAAPSRPGPSPGLTTIRSWSTHRPPQRRSTWCAGSSSRTVPIPCSTTPSRSSPRDSRPMRLTYVGHSTLLIELAGIRLLTDPVLRNRIGHLERRAPPVDKEVTAAVDAVLISHLHHDHFDPGSLASIDRGALLVIPRGGQRAAAKLGFERVVEMTPGDEIDIAGTAVRGPAPPPRPGGGPGGGARTRA